MNTLIALSYTLAQGKETSTSVLLGKDSRFRNKLNVVFLSLPTLVASQILGPIYSLSHQTNFVLL